ncbi:MAG: hypothetical protein HKN24_08845 [Acidimicrobiales bacterium]|nr:hypothetical protein [Acidimicrobiales bacterium]
MTSPTSAATATAVPILEIGRFWMLDEATLERGAELGMNQPQSFWINGRAGVLGEVHPDVVASAVAFVAPSRIAELWLGAVHEGLTPGQRAIEYAAAAGRWADRVFADVPADDLERVTALAAQLALSADPSLGVLFAGWRQIMLPPTPAGAAAVALNVLRELRGAAHIIAVHAVGLGPHAAIVSTDHPVRGGVPGAERFGWGEPHPVPDPEKRSNAEMLTTLITSHCYDSLTEAERGELVELIERLRGMC